MSGVLSQPIILASRSPRRQQLLEQIGVSFELLDIEVDESAKAAESPLDYVQRIARDKALAAWGSSKRLDMKNSEKRALLAADTCVVFNQTILGKPQDSADSMRMLKTLAGNVHQVMTSVVIKNIHQIYSKTSVTEVEFCSISSADMQAYVESGEGIDKAGSYAIQGLAAKFVKSIRGSYSGVVGLPLYETSQLLELHFKDQK